MFPFGFCEGIAITNATILAAKISLVDVTNDKRERPDTSFKICDEKLNGKADGSNACISALSARAAFLRPG